MVSGENMNKGTRIPEKELERRYSLLNTLRAEANKDFDKLIKKIKKEKYYFSYEISQLINLTKDQFRSKVNAQTKQAKTIKQLKNQYTKVKKGWKCKNCKRVFSNLAGIHIHLGKYKCQK